MIPDSIIEYFPKLFRQQDNVDMDALADKLDELFQETLTEIIELRYLLDPERCPVSGLNRLGNFVNAGLKQVDSETTKRQKIYTAIQGHKKRGSWEDDAKPKIDAITGYDARLYSDSSGSDWILMSDGDTDIFPDAYYWASLGADGVDDALGLDLIGDGYEVVVSGNIYINCHYGVTVSTLTADEIAQIVAEISTDIVPAYARVLLGYVDGSGIFQVYAGGIIE